MRFVDARICMEDIVAMEKAGEFLFRHHESTVALEVLTIALRLRQSIGFACNVDESAGMADVIELQGYSRRVPCT